MRDDEEFTLVFNENYSGLCRFLEGMTGRRSVAQELAQECFLRLYQMRSDRAPGEEARFWLYRVARNLALNEIKRRNGRLRLVEKVIDIFRPTRANPEEQCEAEERAAMVRRMFNCLPEHQRAALLLREGEEMSYAEIAGTLGITESKVKVDIFRARQALRAKWNDATETPAALKDERVERGC